MLNFIYRMCLVLALGAYNVTSTALFCWMAASLPNPNPELSDAVWTWSLWISAGGNFYLFGMFMFRQMDKALLTR